MELVYIFQNYLNKIKKNCTEKQTRILKQLRYNSLRDDISKSAVNLLYFINDTLCTNRYYPLDFLNEVLTTLPYMFTQNSTYILWFQYNVTTQRNMLEGPPSMAKPH